MWTVTVDSNVPINTTADTSGRFTPVSFLNVSDRNGDVEELLSSSPRRLQSSNVRGRPPSGRVSLPLKPLSRSPSPSASRQPTSSADWRKTMENAVDVPEEDMPLRNNVSFNRMDDAIDNRCNSWGNSSNNWGNSSRAALRAVHEPEMSLHDSDSGMGSLYKSHHQKFTVDDFKSGLPPRLGRSHSMSRLNRSLKEDSHQGNQTPHNGHNHTGKSVQELHNSLEESELRRNVLMHKLKEAQSTLELQNERLNKIEAAAKENNLLVDDLKFKEREYRNKISQLEAAEEEKQRLKMENLRLREEMQSKISALDHQLKHLKTQHHSTESDNDKRTHLLNHTTTILSLLEEENAKLQQDKEKLLSENTLMKEAFGMTKTRFGSLDNDNRNLKNECIRLKEDNTTLARKVQEMAGQMMELRTLLQAVRDENDRISSTWRMSVEDKSQVANQLEGYKDMIADLKSRLSTTSADRDRMFQEKLEMNSKIQQMVLDKEQLMRAKLNLEDQLNEQHSRFSYRKASDYRQEAENNDLTRELATVKKVCEELTSELSTVKIYYERASEQVAILERSRSLWQSQQELGDHEKQRLQTEIDRLTQLQLGKVHDEKTDQVFQDEQIHKLRVEVKQVRLERNDLENRVQDLEMKLAKGHEGLREGTAFQHTELDTWKNTCERLTSSMARKESELHNLTDRCHELEDSVSGLRQEIRALKDRNEKLSAKSEESERFRGENRRLLQEKAENEQMIKLLETQKSVLTKTSEDGFKRSRELENLNEQVDHLRKENEILRKKNSDLEMQHDTLMHQKEDVWLKRDMLYKGQGLNELEKQLEQQRDANRQLTEVNDRMTRQLDAVNQENTRLKQSLGSSLTKAESDRLREENLKLQRDLDNLRQEFQSLLKDHKECDKNKDTADINKLRKEKDAVQKQVTLLQGQINLMEGSKKRADDEIRKLTSELDDLKVKLSNSNPVNNQRDSHEADAELRKEIETLKQELQKAKENQRQHEKMMTNFKSDNTNDASVVVQELRMKLQEHDNDKYKNEKMIENLERELRFTKEQVESREREMKELLKSVEEMDAENKTLRQDVQEIRDTLAAELAEEKAQQNKKQSKPEKSLQEELSEVVKSKNNGSGLLSPRSNPFRSKSLHHLDLRPASAPPSPSEPVPDKPSSDGTNRLQSLISKYRSHNELEESKVAPPVVPPKIVYKNRLGITAPKSPLKQASEDPPADPLVPPSSKVAEAPANSNLLGVKLGKKLPPAPFPKPASPTTLGTKSSFMRTISADVASKDTSPKPTSTSPLLSLRHSLPLTSSSSTKSLNSSGLGQSLGSAEGTGDTQEQKDINALIQKQLKDRFDEMAAF